MKQIPIYKNEKALAEQIQNARSFSYCQLIEPATANIKNHFAKLPDVVKASETDRDLYFHQSILVSTGRNLNDDVFLPQEVWAARHTPTHKPTNLNHNELEIVGHICNNFVVDNDYNLISDSASIDELPSEFHVLTSSVIYKLFQDENKLKTIAEIIEKIEAGEMFCSMECILNNFDYLLDDGKEQKVVARDRTTSFLTQFLRIYGGTGEFEQYKVYRVLRDINFSGKGYTEKPANPKSVTFSKDNILGLSNLKYTSNNEFVNKVGVSLNSNVEKVNSENIMSDILKDQNDKLEASNKALADEIKSLKDQLAKADVAKLESQIKSLAEQVDKLASEVKIKEDELANASKKISDLTSESETLTKSNKELQDNLNKIEAERVIEKRTASLVEVGVAKADAKLIVDKYTSVADEIFADVVETQKKLVAATKPVETKVVIEANENDEEEEVSADLNKAKPEEKPTLATASLNENKDDELVESFRKIVASAFPYKKK